MQLEDPDGEAGDPVTIYTSDTGRHGQGRYEILRVSVQVADETVAIHTEMVPDDLPEGEDFEDLHRGLIAVSDDLDDLDDWAVSDTADPFLPVHVTRDGGEVWQQVAERPGMILVWRGGTFATASRH